MKVDIEAIKKEFDALTVCGPRIIVRKVPDEEQTASGLFIPLKTQRPVMVAQVVGIGPTAQEGVTLSLGDCVLLKWGAGSEIMLEDVPLLVIEKDQVLAILKPNARLVKRVALIASSSH